MSLAAKTKTMMNTSRNYELQLSRRLGSDVLAMLAYFALPFCRFRCPRERNRAEIRYSVGGNYAVFAVTPTLQSAQRSSVCPTIKRICAGFCPISVWHKQSVLNGCYRLFPISDQCCPTGQLSR